MNAQKFTQKSLEALQAAQDFATEYENMQIEQPHLLAALTAQEDGLIGQMLKKMAIDAARSQDRDRADSAGERARKGAGQNLCLAGGRPHTYAGGKNRRPDEG